MNPLILIHLGIIKPTPEIIKAAKDFNDATIKPMEITSKMNDKQFSQAWNSLFKPQHEIDIEQCYNSLYKQEKQSLI